MKSIPIIIAACLFGTVVGAQDAQDYANCKWDVHGGRLEITYDQFVGPAACAAHCAETESCTAWYYIPNTFNPDTGTGGCGLYPSASEPMPHESEFCGEVEGS